MKPKNKELNKAIRLLQDALEGLYAAYGNSELTDEIETFINSHLMRLLNNE